MFDFIELPKPPKIDSKYISLFPDLQTEEDSSGRFYTYNGMRYPSVTTVLKEEPSDSLKNWIKHNKDKAEFYSDRGHSVHAKVEDWVAGRPIREFTDSPMAELVSAKMFYLMLPHLAKLDTVYASELAMVSPSLELAGRVDLVVGIGGKFAVLDIKNTNKVLELDKIPNYCTQICAYSEMWKEWTGIQITLGIVLNCTESGQVSNIQFDPRNYLQSLNDARKRWKNSH